MNTRLQEHSRGSYIQEYELSICGLNTRSTKGIGQCGKSSDKSHPLIQFCLQKKQKKKTECSCSWNRLCFVCLYLSDIYQCVFHISERAKDFFLNCYVACLYPYQTRSTLILSHWPCVVKLIDTFSFWVIPFS
jgi:hypothetical protein